MIPLARKTADRAINIIVGGIIGTAVAMTVIAAVFSVPGAVTVIVGTVALLFWVVAGLLWLLT